jgi:hypothetical protein
VTGTNACLGTELVPTGTDGEERPDSHIRNEAHIAVPEMIPSGTVSNEGDGGK